MATAMDVEGIEPAATWVIGPAAAERFGSPAAIRAALLPEQVGEFDAGADLSARQTLQMGQLRDVLQVFSWTGSRAGSASGTRRPSTRVVPMPWRGPALLDRLGMLDRSTWSASTRPSGQMTTPPVRQ
jgi:uncharacterized protein DUF6247